MNARIPQERRNDPRVTRFGAFLRRTSLARLLPEVTRKGEGYWYFAYLDLGQKVRMAYVGPDDERVRALVERFRRTRRAEPFASTAQTALGLGCAPAAPKHFRIIRRLAECGFFRAGGVLVGTQAFLAFGNLLGVRWAQAHLWRLYRRERPALAHGEVYGP